MDQIKIGSFLKGLRNEKGLTQEQLAEKVNVSRRSVSRWETGSNLPDLDVLLELADFYQVELRELLDGERKSEPMNQELRETTLMVADYSNEEKQRLLRRMHGVFVLGMAAAVGYAAMYFTGRADGALGGLCLGMMTGVMLVGVLLTSKQTAKIRAFKLRLLGRKEGQE